MVIGGCILIILSILTLILTLTVRKIGFLEDSETVDGVITSSDLQKKEVIVEYKINNKIYSSSFNCEAYANIGEMPPVGLKVQVSVDSQNHSRIIFLHMIRKMGRGLSGTRKYINNKAKENRFKMSFLILILFLSGVYCILNGLSLI